MPDEGVHNEGAEGAQVVALRIEHRVARFLVVGVERLRHGEGVLGQERHLLGLQRLLRDLLAARHEQQQRPDLVSLFSGQQGVQVEAAGAVQQGGHRVSLGLELREDVAGPDHTVLDVGTRLAGKGQGLVHVEGDDLGPAVLQQEVAQGAGGDGDGGGLA